MMTSLLFKTAQGITAAIFAGMVATLSPDAGAAVVLQGSFELTGDQEVAPSGSSVIGFVDYALNMDEKKLSLLMKFVGDIDFDGTQTTSTLDDVIGLHVQYGPPGTNGPIVFGIMSPSDETNDNSFIVPPSNQVLAIWDANEGTATTLVEQLPNLLAGDLYVNLRTNQFPEGEIRGQIGMPVPEPTGTSLLALALMLAILHRHHR
jgi:hypothetical protein